MLVYLASPRNQLAAHLVNGMPVLLSFPLWSNWLSQYVPTFSRLLIDSGAFSELNSGIILDPCAYRDWSQQWIGRAEAIAGLDNISGNWKLSLANYNAIPWSFPTYHDTDPPELLEELIQMAKERKTWLGIGLLPPRTKREKWLLETFDRIPNDLHVHLWAGRRYTYLKRINSVDSTNWYRDAMAFKTRMGLEFLSYGECLELVIKRYKRTNPKRSQEDSSDERWEANEG